MESQSELVLSRRKTLPRLLTESDQSDLLAESVPIFQGPIAMGIGIGIGMAISHILYPSSINQSNR
ncbi:hypothetical protein ERO13_A11G101550v2 [Gossypium hirsutum]|uniref:Uncharacterized protein n=1 Tax=Gossypium barbadense TaxID=3634 RepID=A0A5J5TPA0_GOSBA|nr:hypothetical protein ES319_A11G109200v1 [Gossypium barbadense]KAG4174141.1 hypothetical protein ERO13_A11G101550v2 [Gossypium hirsutum]